MTTTVTFNYFFQSNQNPAATENAHTELNLEVKSGRTRPKRVLMPRFSELFLLT